MVQRVKNQPAMQETGSHRSMSLYSFKQRFSNKLSRLAASSFSLLITSSNSFQTCVCHECFTEATLSEDADAVLFWVRLSVLRPLLRCVSVAFAAVTCFFYSGSFFTLLPGHTLSWVSSSSLDIPSQSPLLVPPLLCDLIILEGHWVFFLGLFLTLSLVISA